MKALLERLRAARHIELGLLLVALAVLGLMLLNGGGLDRESAATPLERRLVRLLEQIDGVGRVSAMITEGEDGSIAGAVIVADGLDSLRVALDIRSATRTLLNVDPDRVCVIGKNGAQYQ